LKKELEQMVEVVKAQFLHIPHVDRVRLVVDYKEQTRAGYAWSCDLVNSRSDGHNAGKVVLANWILQQWNRKDIVETLCHELAHALVPYGNHHNQVWRSRFMEILNCLNVPIKADTLDRCYPEYKMRVQTRTKIVFKIKEA